MVARLYFRRCFNSHQFAGIISRWSSSSSSSSSSTASPSSAPSLSNLPTPVRLGVLKCEPRKLDFDKNSILIYHGLFGSRINWRSLGKALAERTQRLVVALDVRNHGSSLHADEMSYPAMVSDALEVMNNKKYNKATLIGHSLGGRAFIQFALTIPERVEKLVIVDVGMNQATAPHNHVEYLRAMRDSLKDIPPNSSRMEAKKIVDHRLKPVVVDPFIRGFLLLNLVETEDKKITWQVNLDSLEKAMGQGMLETMQVEGTYDGPVLLVYGGKSKYVDDNEIQRMGQHFPNLKTHCIKDGTHYLHVEKSQEFLECTVNFINS